MPNTGRLQHHTGGVTEFAILVAQGNDGIESGDPGHVQGVTTKQPDEANASEKETTATEPEVLLNIGAKPQGEESAVYFWLRQKMNGNWQFRNLKKADERAPAKGCHLSVIRMSSW
ncbi:hypothetical protein PC120_g20824 [Phytophthora cactorum]|nr:hypothetical protein PC120_g20824 [Phytophthora cactorum]